MMDGVNPATFLILPMLGKHPDEYPRFRDCFADDKERLITVYTRTGGGNRGGYSEENEELTRMPEYIEDNGDDFDSTYAYFTFRVPKRFEKDYDLILKGRLMETSEEYKRQVDSVYPKLKGKLPWHRKEKNK